MQRRHISLLLNSACHVSCTNIDALQQVEARLKQLQVLRFVMSQLCAALRTFESPHFDPDVDSWQPSYHCYWQKVFRYNTSVTRPRGGEKLPHIVFLHLNFLFTSYWIVPRKRTNVALNFELWICHNRANSPGYALYILCRKALGDKVIYFQFQFKGLASFQSHLNWDTFRGHR